MEKREPNIGSAAELAPLNPTASSHSMAAARSRRKLSTSSRSFRVRKRSSFISTTTTLAAHPTRTHELFKEPLPVSVLQSTSADLSWYHPWLHGQVTNMSHAVRQLRVGEETLLENNAFERVFTATGTFVRDTEMVTIDDVVEHLRKTQKMENTRQTFKAQRLLVFAILGWQSMLYRPAFNTCSGDELAVHEDDDESNSGLVFDTNKVSADLADRPLFVILKGFGNLLPSPPSNITQAASENSRAAATWLPLNPAEMNAHLLLTLLHVRIRWVDCLALHLDYNKSSRTLSLFSCPSFYVAMLQSKGTIFSFASTEKKSFDPRASEEDISQFMRELLLMLCMTAHIRQKPEPLPLLPDQPVYFAAQHFPVLSERIELIAQELKNSRPTSISELLRDRRDTLQYWTFWLVSIIGVLSVILSLVQVILQVLQLSRG
ncbi:uncharacterized protein BDZ99DRAFT_508447 [Mytilinidion resinicola]|uniref:Uncharacterized protein n=1 Tax=Mytilinidion resinicola TaxID=574789 RepID=A0A6A6YQR0_9PEZI|nr:uncharacterized protein BDZ99DRAFT_508447 [Mytilinidion resinicola]KAF2811120.1 hypothetical protein BDZ99DRAFT_508447 [Mytilinidion resinicola]